MAAVAFAAPVAAPAAGASSQQSSATAAAAAVPVGLVRAFPTSPTRTRVGAAGAGAGRGADRHVFLGAACAAAAAVIARRRHGCRAGRAPPRQRAVRPGNAYSLVKTPKGTFEALVEKGQANAAMTTWKTLHASVMGGAYVGMAGLLSLAISGNMGAQASMGFQRLVFAALFPVNLLLVLQSGAQLFTGNTATLSMGWFEGKVSMRQLAKSWTISYIGNVIGCGSLALVAWYTGLLVGGTAELAAATAVKKCALTFGQTLVKAIMCNWLVCMAVFLATSANDLAGKMVGIWFPISMFVAIGFEHSVANMFLLPAGLLAGASVGLKEVLVQNLLPVTIGNALAGALIIGAGFSYSQGRMGSRPYLTRLGQHIGSANAGVVVVK